jgi:hypothetical protein
MEDKFEISICCCHYQTNYLLYPGDNRLSFLGVNSANEPVIAKFVVVGIIFFYSEVHQMHMSYCKLFVCIPCLYEILEKALSDLDVRHN